MKIKKVQKLVANLHDKTELFIHIRNLKQALNYGLVLKKVHRIHCKLLQIVATLDDLQCELKRK